MCPATSRHQVRVNGGPDVHAQHDPDAPGTGSWCRRDRPVDRRLLHAGPIFPTAPEPPHVKTVAAAPRDVPLETVFPGRVEPIQRVELRARVGGALEAVLFKEGARVSAGTPLFRVDQRPTRLRWHARRRNWPASRHSSHARSGNSRARSDWSHRTPFPQRKRTIVVARPRSSEGARTPRARQWPMPRCSSSSRRCALPCPAPSASSTSRPAIW